MNKCEECPICGDDINNEYKIKLKCNHEFHYNCIYLSFKNTKLLHCPYCRQTVDKLPLVNGIKKICPYIHDIKKGEIYESDPCKFILQTGKNKGKICGRFPQLGCESCKIHNKKTCQFILKSGKNKGEMCGNFCQTNYNTCKRHTKMNIIP